jgi:hypothetical protein
VSRVRQKGLASTRPTGISSRLNARPMARAWRRPAAFRLRWREQSRRFPVMSVAVRSVAAWRSATTYPPLRSRSTGGAERRSPRPLASGCRSPEPLSSEPRSQPAAAASTASTSGSTKRRRTRPRLCQFGVPRTPASRHEPASQTTFDRRPPWTSCERKTPTISALSQWAFKHERASPGRQRRSLPGKRS